jgi:hypothetical protein
VRRIFWLATGLGAGATGAMLTSRWLRRQRERFAPSNIGRQAGMKATELAGRVVDAGSEFRTGMAEREAEIRLEIERDDLSEDEQRAPGGARSPR